MSDLDSALEWVEYAEEDFIVAKSALRRKKVFGYDLLFSQPAMRGKIPQVPVDIQRFGVPQNA
ncbi:MAG: hypothetical protein AMXMBFR60_19390 [Chloroflexota bacterium]